MEVSRNYFSHCRELSLPSPLGDLKSIHVFSEDIKVLRIFAERLRMNVVQVGWIQQQTRGMPIQTVLNWGIGQMQALVIEEGDKIMLDAEAKRREKRVCWKERGVLERYWEIIRISVTGGIEFHERVTREWQGIVKKSINEFIDISAQRKT